MEILRKIASKVFDSAEGKSVSDEYINFVYEDIYLSFQENSILHRGRIPDTVLELGAGSLSKSNDFFLDVTLSDGSNQTKYGEAQQIRAERLPFQDSQFELIIAKDTLHHFNDVVKGLGEVSRVLSPKGLFIVSEPYWSPLGRFVFRFLHPEKWITKPQSLFNDSEDQLNANQATLLVLTSRKYIDVLKDNGLELQVLAPTYGISYLISGGLNWRTKVPFKLLKQIYTLEKKQGWILKWVTGLNIIAIFKKI
jgi:SAM-dependent methyltransferase